MRVRRRRRKSDWWDWMNYNLYKLVIDGIDKKYMDYLIIEYTELHFVTIFA